MVCFTPGRSAGYPRAPPTDPDVKVSLIRFLGNQSLGTTLAHNFAALQAKMLYAVDNPGFRERKLDKNRARELFPINSALTTSPT